ncbi:hypothetical protein D3C87_1234310 [compost metagenome]
MVVRAGSIGVEAVVLLAGQGQAQVTILPARALAGVKVVDAALAPGDLHARTVTVGRPPGNDVDHRHQGIGAVADGIRPAKDFDALDVFHGHRNVAPVDGGQAGAIHRAPVDQHLHAPRFIRIGAVVVHRRLIAADVADHHPRHQAQQFADVAGTAGVDQGAVDHRHASRNGRRRLLQTCGGEHLRQRFAVQEQVVGQHWRAEYQRQYQRRMR